ncbi:MAG TPA: helix-turn-helix domain-containing protein [Thermoanaerobaculia bacterium]|jgi:AraC-like DNA-binding protein|nr:helix-turn-helix domain-containing protein [Thermoanaerobaculia bacterium]
MPEPASFVRKETETAHREAVERVIRTLKHDPAAELPLEELARLALISRFHFNRVFRQLTGIPPGQFHSALRLQEAKRLLLTTDLSVLDVCFEVGYQSPGTFIRRFTELVGLPPQRLRWLSRRAAPALEHLAELPPPDAVPGPRIRGSVAAPPGFSGPVFAGLFQRPIPQGLPAAFAMLARPGRFWLPAVPDGDYHLLAATLPPLDAPGGPWDTDAGLRAGSLLRVRDGGAAGVADLVLRPAEPLDPPILLAYPLLAAERLQTGPISAAPMSQTNEES